MSHYDCVLPVDFERLSLEVMPAWLDFIAGEREPRVFANEFAPWQVGVGDLEDYWPEDPWQEAFDLPPAYIEWFRNHEMTQWKTDAIRADLSGLLTDKSLPWCADDLLMLAIKQSSAIELPGFNQFEPSGIEPFTWMRFYGRLHDPPFVQVVGTKNRFHFLEELYVFKWENPQPFYSCVRKEVVSAETYGLLERLFLSVRAFPGANLNAKPLTWNCGDDGSLMGFLTPDETQNLAERIPELDAVLTHLKYKPFAFALFTDRLERAARCGAGLVTLFDGL